MKENKNFLEHLSQFNFESYLTEKELYSTRDFECLNNSIEQASSDIKMTNGKNLMDMEYIAQECNDGLGFNDSGRPETRKDILTYMQSSNEMSDNIDIPGNIDDVLAELCDCFANQGGGHFKKLNYSDETNPVI